MNIQDMQNPRKGQAVQCVKCRAMIYTDKETVKVNMDGIPYNAYYHNNCVPVLNWVYIESKNDYNFWKLESTDNKGNPAIIYNVTKDGNPPINESGYYSYGYLWKVKGLIKGITVSDLFI